MCGAEEWNTVHSARQRYVASLRSYIIQIHTVRKHMKTDGSPVFPDGGSYIARRKDLSDFTS